jgi:hypothetical protein
MEMNASTRPEVLRQTDHVQERPGDAGVDTMLQELCSDERTPQRNTPWPCVPDEGASETFIDGAGV